MISIEVYSAKWCNGCVALEKVLEGQEYNKIDVEENIEMSARYGIRNLPSTLFKKDGEIKAKHVGLMTVEQFIEYKNLCL